MTRKFEVKSISFAMGMTKISLMSSDEGNILTMDIHGMTMEDAGVLEDVHEGSELEITFGVVA